MKQFAIVIGLLLLAAAAAAVVVYLDLMAFARKPAAADGSEQVLQVRSGQGFQEVADALHRAGIVSDAEKFGRYARVTGLDKKIRAGEYVLAPTMTPGAVLQAMVNGRVKLYRVTVPEGYNLKQIAKLVGDAGLVSEAAFLAAAFDETRVHEAGLEGTSFEGYLFPDTYFFPKTETSQRIIAAMVDHFRSVFTTAWRERAEQLGFSVHDIVTLASIIEKETGDPSERPLISSVFHNRLKKRMRLESDPTVIYGIADFDGNLTRTHLTTRTPYNTYKIRGLPPGPIASPGRAALEAALYPAETDYLYFVSKRDTTHQFSTNFKDHSRAVRKYQLRRR